ncbi:MAG: hypothetical protein Q4Q18_00950, partial [Methanobrevibacter sp.]|nr:hypothetical protein [Methanobrevibacter sp.]
MILTMGAVSASENITDDQLTVEDEANIYGNSQEDELAEVQYVDGFGVEFQQSIALNSESELLWVNNYEHKDGNLKININDNPAPAYNKKLSDTVEVKLADLGITSMGNYKIAASFQPTNGNPIKLL